MSRWVLIGGAGFLGQKIANILIKNKIPKNKIVIADKQKFIVKTSPQVIHKMCDISKNIIPKLNKDDIVIHLAARQYHNKIPFLKQLNWFREVNVIGTNFLINACIKYNVKGLIFFSSDMVYGIPSSIPIKPNHIRKPLGPYGKSKLEAENLCIKSREKGLNTTILRPRLIMGPGRLGVMKKLFEAIAKNKPVPLIGNGLNYYQMVSVEDCANAAILAVKKEFPNIELNLGSLPGTNVKMLLKKVIEEVKSKSILLPLPAILVKSALKLLDNIGYTILHPEQYKIANKNYIVDISDTYSRLGWKPKYTDKDMIIDAYKFWKNSQQP